jgi:hypothetical protein
MSTYTPIFATFTDEDIQTIERERERDSKRKRRATRARRGVILPDREPAKTQRTLLNPIGANGVIARAATELAAVPAITSSRRAAAIAAQANINLLAQDLPLPQPPTPPPTNHPYKPGKGRGRGQGRGAYNNNSRNSPASYREGSILGDREHQTPIPQSALKRSYRDESSDLNSPVLSKIARGIPTSSPTLVNEPHPHLNHSQGVKLEQPFQAQAQPPPPPQVEIKRKSDDMIDPRETKSVKLDPMLGFDSNPQSRSDSPSTSGGFPQPKADRFMPSSPSTSDSGSESSDSDYGAPKKSKSQPKKSLSMTPAQVPRVISGSPQVQSTPSVVVRTFYHYEMELIV